MDANTALLGIGAIITFGFFAEFVFKKTGIPDVLLLVLLGFLIGPGGMGLADPAQLAAVSPLFTTFALLCLVFDGALSIDLFSLSSGLMPGTVLSFFNYAASVAAVTLVLLLFDFPFIIALLIGCLVSDTSEAFALPILQKLKPRGIVFTIIALETALTDVFVIVFGVTVIELIKVATFSFQGIVNQIMSLFAVAAFVGIIGAALWIVLDRKLFKENKSYMAAIAFLILLHVVTEFAGGNGALAALFFGLVLKNARTLTSIVRGIGSQNLAERSRAMEGDLGVSVLTKDEQQFFDEISFFLKTFFFVYVGMFLNLGSTRPMLIGGAIALAIVLSRQASRLLTRKMFREDQDLIASFFARGLAAAAVVQIAWNEGVLPDATMLESVYFAIVCTVLLSSIALFVHKLRFQVLPVPHTPVAARAGEPGPRKA